MRRHRAIDLADRLKDKIEHMAQRAMVADTLHTSGEQAETLQRECQHRFNLLYSRQGFRCCDVLLAPTERAVWQVVNTKRESRNPKQIPNLKSEIPNLKYSFAAHSEAQRRANTIFSWRGGTIWNPAADAMFGIALDHLTPARVALYRAILEHSNPKSPIPNLKSQFLNLKSNNPRLAPALNGLRQSG